MDDKTSMQDDKTGEDSKGTQAGETDANGKENKNHTDGFDDIRFSLVHTFQIPSEEEGKTPWIKHIEILSDGNLLLADWYNHLLYLYDTNGIRIKTGKLPSGPWSMAITNSNQAAITLPEMKQVFFVSADTLKSTKKVNVRDDCRGIAHVNSKIIVNCVTIGLKVLTITGRTLKIFPRYVGHISLTRGPNEKLLCSLFAVNRIVCLNLKGKKRYEFTDPLLSGPCSFAVDNVRDYVYVVGHHCNNIHMFGDKGKKSRILMSKKDGIDRPWAIAYDSCVKRLVISNFGGKNITVLQQVEVPY